MAHKRKSLSMVGILDEAQVMAKQLLIERPRAWLETARERMRDMPKTNFDLGCDFADQGKWWDAVFRFRVTAYLDPNYPQVWYNLGLCYSQLNRVPKAIAALQTSLQQNPTQQQTIFTLLALDPNALPQSQRPTRMPKEMIADFFTPLAANYDVEEAANQYQGGKVAYELARPLLKVTSPVVLDLACGTGIAARPWRVSAKEMIGIDSTPALVTLAEKMTHSERNLFDRVIEADAANIPATVADGSVDVVQLINAAQFIGDLSGVMRGAARVLAPNGVLVVTAESHTSGVGYGVRASGKFGHAPSYVNQVARDAGLTAVRDVPVQLYPGLSVHTFTFMKGAN